MRHRLIELGLLFLRLGCVAFGGPAAHIALIERECVQRRGWLPREQFLDLLGVSSLIPGPTSTELVMHVGRLRAGWRGLVVAGVAFIAPAAILMAFLAAAYVRFGELPALQEVLALVQPVVVLIVLQAVVPLGRSAMRSLRDVLFGAAVALLAVAGVPELRLLLLAGITYLLLGRLVAVTTLALAVSVPVLHAAGGFPVVPAADVGWYFLRTGALLFGSGYVLLPVLQDDLVVRLGWLTQQQLLDAIAAGQATPGPVFTTATFIGYAVAGGTGAVVATVAMFLPAFVFSAISSVALERWRSTPSASLFLHGVNLAAVALIGVTVVSMARATLTEFAAAAVACGAAVALFALRLNPAVVLVAAAGVGLVWGLW